MPPKTKKDPKGDGDKPDKPKGGTPDPKQDTIDQDQIEEDYGLSYALFKAFPGLNDLLKDAVAEGYTPAQFQVQLRQTDWFKKHSDVWRENTALSYSDPATFEERYQNTLAKVQNIVAAVGAQMTDKGVERLARRTLLLGFSDDELHNKIAQFVRPGAGGYYTGDLAGIEGDLRSTALQNGVQLHDDQLKKWMQAIVRGDASQDQYVTNIRAMAAQMFPLYGEQIKGGMDLADVANPYLQSMSTLLELAPGSITLDDPTIRKALAGQKDNAGKVTSTSISDFEDSLRQDKRWLYTKSAKTMAEGFASSLAKMWGLTA